MKEAQEKWALSAEYITLENARETEEYADGEDELYTVMRVYELCRKRDVRQSGSSGVQRIDNISS